MNFFAILGYGDPGSGHQPEEVAFMRRLRIIVILAALTGGLVACGPNTGGSSAQPCTGSGARPIHHVVEIWMENHSESDVIGSSSAPYTTSLAQQCATFTDAHTVGSPSYPNYLGATSGSNQGVSSDTVQTFNVANIFRQTNAVEYHDGATGCDQVGSDNAAKHEPRMSYAQPSTICAQTQPLGAFDPNSLPSFAFVTPTLCHDMHNCSVAVGDAWLKSFVPSLLDGANYAAGDTLVMIIWDESTPYANVWLNPATAAGTTGSTVDHYDELRTVQDLLGLGCLANSCGAKDVRSTIGL